MRKTIWSTSIVVALAAILSGVSCASPSAATPTSAAPTPSATASQPTIAITYSATFTLEPVVGSLLVLDMIIENRGYQSFNTSPAYFSVVVTNLTYPYDASRSDLKAVNLADGGKISGKLVFQVPSGTASSRVGFRPVYSGTQVYNVQWTQR